jgi:hypothetical protein
MAQSPASVCPIENTCALTPLRRRVHAPRQAVVDAAHTTTDALNASLEQTGDYQSRDRRSCA